MKAIKYGILILLLSLPMEIWAQRISVDAGVVQNNSPGYIGEVSIETRGILFFKTTVGFFDHQKEQVAFFAGAIGARTSRSKFFLEGMFGCAAITRATSTLGTPLELRTTVTTGWAFKKVVVQLNFMHFSNARRLFRFRPPNVGENFLTLGVGWNL